MNKLAQQRGLLNKLREQTHLTGKMLEKIDPDFQDMMERLRSTDEKIRIHAEQMKDFVRAAKSNLNRRDYLSSATNLSAFHERCRYISAELDKFIKSIDLNHYKFLLDQFDDDQKEQLFGYNPNKKLNLDETSDVSDHMITASLKKKAGISDWWFSMTDPLADVAHNLTTGRGQAMRKLEKKFNISFLKDLKTESTVIVVRTQKFLNLLLNTFKKLATALATRHVDMYVETSKLFIVKFSEYHNRFVKYYTKVIVPLKTQQEKIQKELAAKEKLEEENKAKALEDAAEQERISNNPIDPEALEEQEKQRLYRNDRRSKGLPLSGPDTGVGLKVNEGPKEITNPNSGQALNNIDKLRQQKEKQDADLKKERDATLNRLDQNIPLNLTKKKSNDLFITRIEKIAATNNPKALAIEILKYSEYIENTSPIESLKLLAIAEGILEDKKAGIFDFTKNKPDNDLLQGPIKKEEPVPLV